MNYHISALATVEPRSNNGWLVLFPLPFQGHINPMLQLASILYTKGFKIIIIHTDFNSPNQSNYPQFTFRSISDGLTKSEDGAFVVGEKSYFKTAIKEELALMTEKDIEKVYKGGSEKGKEELICNMIKETKAASGIIFNTFKELEEPAFLAISQDFQIPSFLIGPFHKYFPASSSSLLEQDRSSILWLDKQPVSSVVYVSFGSIAQMGEAEFTEMAWGLANSKQRFLWVVRPGSVSGSQWLESLPKGFKEEVGVMLDKEMNREETGIAIKCIMEKEGSEMRERSKYLQEKVNQSMQKGGSAYQSLDDLVDCILSFSCV
ncbi:hypothetical protein L1987_35897 [Smallanthus sonchifolius]|uniref:Uncharacterized protein n=1 Tax=Smallanthus sonchifolius TaxID=185202 RepID=A0ACB9HCP0_9ASTR|nr:hypothetical protein L1987_35897 [Smallanthus sonchifolius]